MNLQPMSPSPYSSSGELIYVFCSRCDKRCSGADVDCDLDAAPGTYYCQDCVIKVILESSDERTNQRTF